MLFYIAFTALLVGVYLGWKFARFTLKDEVHRELKAELAASQRPT